MKLTHLTLAAFSVYLALPLVALAADGSSCSFTAPGAAAGTIGTAAAANINMPSDIHATPSIECRVLADKSAAGAFTAGPMWVPGGGQNIDLAIVRVIQGTSASGCGYDDVNVYTLSNTNTAAGAELPSLGTLDDDGSSSGVKQIEHFGSIGPYIYLSGTATASSACDSTHHLIIQLLLYPKLQR